MEKFWFVWCESKGVPKYKHISIRSAREEAARLAKANPGCSFIILESITECCCNQPVNWYPHNKIVGEEVPF